MIKQIQGMTKSLKFDGVDDYVDTGADWIGTGDITICGWIKPYSTGEGGLGRILSNGKLVLHAYTGNTLRLSSDGGTTNATAQAQAIKLFRWNFFTVKRTSTGFTTFKINGARSGNENQNSGTPVAGDTNVIIGNKADTTLTFNGLIKNLQVFNRLLTEEEENNIYLSMEMPVDYSTSILRDFRFEHDSDTIVTSYNDINLRGNISGATYSNDTPSRGVVEKPDYGYGLSFDGVDDFISLGNINIMGGSAEAITIGGVLKINATASAIGYLIQKRREFQILYNTTTNLVQFRLSNASTDAIDYYVSATKDLKDGLHSIYGTWDKNGTDTNLRLYIDGVLVGTSAMTLDTLYQSTNTVYIGRQHGGQYSNGIYHKFLLFNKALSATEVSNLHHKNTVPTANLVAQYLLNEGSGTTAIDTSGNGNNGTITGATYVKI